MFRTVLDRVLGLVPGEQAAEEEEVGWCEVLKVGDKYRLIIKWF